MSMKAKDTLEMELTILEMSIMAYYNSLKQEDYAAMREIQSLVDAKFEQTDKGYNEAAVYLIEEYVGRVEEEAVSILFKNSKYVQKR